MKVVSDKQEISKYLGEDIRDLLFNLYDGYVRIVDPLKRVFRGFSLCG